MNLEPIPKSRLYLQIIDQIKEQINAGQFKPGSRLPSERELAEKLQVGRSSVREAITVLESLGLIEVRQGTGTYVRDFSDRSSMRNYLESSVLLWDIEPSQILEVVQVRQMLEPRAAKLAAENATREDVLELREAVEKMREAAALGVVAEETDFNFHYNIARSSGNNVLLGILNTLSDLLRKGLRQTRWLALARPERVWQIVNEHESVLRALEEKNSPAAYEHMLKHLQGVEENFKRYMKED